MTYMDVDEAMDKKFRQVQLAIKRLTGVRVNKKKASKIYAKMKGKKTIEKEIKELLKEECY